MERLGYYVRIGILLLVALATFYFLVRVRAVLFPFLLGAGVAYVLFPLVKRGEKRGLGRGWTLLMLYMAAIGVIGILLWTFIPRLSREIAELALLMPGNFEDAKMMLESLDGMELGPELRYIIETSLGQIESRAYQVLENFINDILGLAGSIIALILAPILAYYLVIDWEKTRDGLLSFFPVHTRGKLTELGMEINQVLWGFIQGHLVVCCIVGLLTGLLAAVLGIQYAVIIGIINGIAELFPYVGPILGAIPSLALALGEGPGKVVYLGVGFLVIQQLESNFLSPRIVGDRVGLHPLVVIFALLSGGELFGIWGILLAVPVAAVLKVLIKFAFYQVVD